MPYGEELTAGAAGRLATDKYTNGADSVRQRFTGYEKDQESGLDFAEARYYNNRHGRFTAVDPLLASGKSANPQTFNRYVYVGNNPVGRIDPTGLEWYSMTEGGITSIKWYGKDDKVESGYHIYFGPSAYELNDGSNNWVYLHPEGPNSKGLYNGAKDGWHLDKNAPQSMSSTPVCQNAAAPRCEGVEDVSLDIVLDFEGLRGAGGLIKEGVEGLGNYFFRKEGASVLSSLRKSLGIEGKNLAVMDYEIEGVGKGTDFAVSGAKSQEASVVEAGGVGVPPQRTFETKVVNGLGRKNDSEVKLFESLRPKISNSQANGYVNLFTERIACDSCKNVATQFFEHYPNIKVKIFNGENNHIFKP